MEAKRIRYPIGVQTFRDIVEGGYLYIDKTGFVHSLAEDYKYVFLSRPRRFGKSLLSSTLHCYFEGKEELFEGLEAGRLKKGWTRHPVFHFDLSTAKHCNEGQLLSELNLKLLEYESVYGKVAEEKEVNQRFLGLVRRAVEQTGEKAVIIIDEYDAPLLDVMNDDGRLKPMRQIMRNFYSPIKSLDPYLRFVFITGINKFAQLSIFSELNNLQNISMMPKYSAICGISQSELERDMAESVNILAQRQGLSYGEALGQLKYNYDGYHFCGQSEDIYNPFSLIKCLDAQDFGSYWFETGTPTFLIEWLRKAHIDETSLDRMTSIPSAAFDISPEISTSPLPVLYQTGYLTIKDYNPRTRLYTLGYPNEEVRIGFSQCLLASYNRDTSAGSIFVAQFFTAMDSGDINEALSFLQSFMAGIPYDLENKTEKHYQTIIYLVFSLLGYYTRAEVKSAVGRADAVCWTRDGVYVFEFKVDGSAEEALRQIDEKGYMIPYRGDPAGSAAGAAGSASDKAAAEPASGLANGQVDGPANGQVDGPASGQANGPASGQAGGEVRKLVKVGVNISTATRTIESWKVAEE